MKLKILTSVGVLILTCSPKLVLSARAAEDVPAAIRLLSESLSTVEFRSEDRLYDDRGTLLRTDQIEFALASGGRRAYKRTDVRDGAIYAISEVREDGRKLYRPHVFLDNLTIIDRLTRPFCSEQIIRTCRSCVCPSFSP